MLRPTTITILLAAVSVLAPAVRSQGLPPPPYPFENPITPQKAVLGKILYWDEQVSSDGTMACGSCHRPASGGADPRAGLHPGADLVFGNVDDAIGSPGIVRSTAAGRYASSPLFGLHPQVTGRTAPTNLAAAYFRTLRWDGLAVETFRDPVTQQVKIMLGGALETHAAGPPVADNEMAYAQRGWNDIAAKLAIVTPLKLASGHPPDVAAALAQHPTYADLMRNAYGDPAITAERIIYAIATYERTLIPDRSPWDRFIGGDASALTPDQQAGLAVFAGPGHCALCHVRPLFSDGSFHNLGIRPVAEDIGWQVATRDPNDRGKFKTPTLRNVGLRSRFMHNGRFATLAEVVDFYDAGGGAFTDNKDPLLVPLGLTAKQKTQLLDFLANGLTDPRAAAEAPPFDRPVLFAENRVPVPFGSDHAGTGGVAPRSLFAPPLAENNPDFKFGVAEGLAGAAAVLVLGATRAPPNQTILGGVPLHVGLQPPVLFLPVTLDAAGSATVLAPIGRDPTLVGQTIYHQWLVADAVAVGGLSSTRGVGALAY